MKDYLRNAVWLLLSGVLMWGCGDNPGDGSASSAPEGEVDVESIEGSVIVTEREQGQASGAKPTPMPATNVISGVDPGRSARSADLERELGEKGDYELVDNAAPDASVDQSAEAQEPAGDEVSYDKEESNPGTSEADSGQKKSPSSEQVAAMAGVLENQREQTLDPSKIGSSLRDLKPLASDPDFMDVNFNQLASFKYDIPDEFMLLEEGSPEPENKPVIPQKIRDLSGKKVAVTGFMLPLKVEKGLVTELLLMRDQSMCCFGTVPEINEWISIKASTDSDGFKPINDQAVTFFGELRVDEIRENGYLVGIYEMQGYRMVGPDDFKEW